MKITHWAWLNGSGMGNVASSLVAAERALGLDSAVGDAMNAEAWEAHADADVHVCHTHIPDAMKGLAKKPYRTVYVGHGTPEHVYQSAVESGTMGGYGHSDGWMLLQRWLQVADARVTFWPRHQVIYQSLCDRSSIVDCVPLGVDTAHCATGVSRGKFQGAPSVWTGENQHYIKWILDLVIAWPWVMEQMPEAKLHGIYIPKDQHRWLFPLANRNGASYGAHLSPMIYPSAELPAVFKSIDFFIGLVRYGDFNRLCLEANASGATTISYAGNPYSDYWLMEGDQRTLAVDLVKILRGETEKRVKSTVPDIGETVTAMRAIYERVLA